MTLASALGDEERALRAAEAKIEALLTMLFKAEAGGWRGWQFVAGQDNRYGIEVYEAKSSREAIRQLFAVGFTSVTIHAHPAKRFVTCACRTYDAY